MSRYTCLLSICTGLCLAPCAGAGARLDFEPVRRWAVQDQGRVKPLDTLARDTAKTVTGKAAFSAVDPLTGATLAPDGDPLDTLLSMLFQTEAWARSPVIRIKSAHLKQAIGLPLERTYFTPEEIQNSHEFHTLADQVIEKSRRDEKIIVETETKCLELIHQMNLLQRMRSGGGLLLVPPQRVETRYDEASWSALEHAEGVDAETRAALAAMMGDVRDAYLNRDPQGFHAATTALGAALRNVSPQVYPAPATLALEVHYNRLRPFHWAFALYFLGFVCWVLALGADRKPVTALAWALTVAGLALHSYGFVLRVVLSGRAPVSNMYESMVFLCWGVIVFGIIFEAIYRSRYFLLSSTIAGGGLMLMAHVLPIDSGIGVLVPVLRSNYWLIIHVLTIMLSYSAFAVAWALGHVMLVQVIANPRNTSHIGEMCNFVYRTLQVGVLLLAAGTILGGVWANASWGRYWGWDPKETWALICLLGYVAVLHARFTNWIGNFGMAVSSVLAFMLVVMCYYGVNFVLPQGLHSYGAGSGGIHYAIGYVIADTIFVAVAVARWHFAGRPRLGRLATLKESVET